MRVGKKQCRSTASTNTHTQVPLHAARLGLQEGSQGHNHTVPWPHPANPGGPCRGEWGTSGQGCGFPQNPPSQPCQTKARAASKAIKKLNGIAHWLADKAKGKSWGIRVDTKAWYVCADSHRQSEVAAMDPNAPAYVTWLAESTKHAKCGDLCTARGIQHLPAAFNAYGGWGGEILGKLEAFFKKGGCRLQEGSTLGGCASVKNSAG